MTDAEFELFSMLMFDLVILMYGRCKDEIQRSMIGQEQEPEGSNQASVFDARTGTGQNLPKGSHHQT